MQRSKKHEKIKVILDTTSYIAAILSSNGVSAKIFEMIIKEEIFNFYTNEILTELRQVISREKFSLEKEKQEQFVHLVQEISFLINAIDTFNVKKCRDPKDDKFLSLSKQIEADFLVTWDEDLLVIKNIGITRILKPSEFIQINFN